MSRLNWGASNIRRYETGIDQGVLYIDGQPGVPWVGMTSVTENSAGGVAKSFYIDGEKYYSVSSREEFQAVLTAYTYPDEFLPCDGFSPIRPGLFATKQKRKTFGLSYRTLIGNDQTEQYAYKIHLIYNAFAAPSNRVHKSNGGTSEFSDFSWQLTSIPGALVGYRRTSHIIVDSRSIDSVTLAALEDILYGNNSSSSRLPSISEIIDLIDTGNRLVVVDNGDGTFSMTAPIGELYMLDSSAFQLTWSTAVFVDANTYTVSSS